MVCELLDAVCGIYFPDLDGSWAPALGAQVLATGPPEKSQEHLFFNLKQVY